MDELKLRELASALSGCPMVDLITFRMREDGFLVVIVKSGQKYTYSPERLVLAQAGMPALRSERGTFVSPREQDADGVPEIIKRAGKTRPWKRGKKDSE